MDLLDLAVGFGRDGHLVDGGEGADDVDRARHRVLLNDRDGDGLRVALAIARLSRVGLPATGSGGGEGGEQEKRNGLIHFATTRCASYGWPVMGSFGTLGLASKASRLGTTTMTPYMRTQ